MNRLQDRPPYEREIELLRAVFCEPSDDWDLLNPFDILTTSSKLHFVIAEIVIPKIMSTFGVSGASEDYVGSAFDEYDRENGYNALPEKNIWQCWQKNANEILHYAIKHLKESYTSAITTPLLPLLDFIEYQVEKNND